MRIGVAAFTEKGGRLGRLLIQEFRKAGHEAEGFLAERHHVEGMHPFADLGSVARELFEKKDILVFVGACGIAVRAIAPCIRSKMEDPGVLVADECGKYVISLLSGHVGRANEFTRLTARILNAEPVITTATDCSGLFAVDDWAVRNGLRIMEPAMIREISSRILAGEKAGFYSDLPVEGELPEGLTEEETGAGIVVSYLSPLSPDGSYDTIRAGKKFPLTCLLVPMDLTVGIGCRKGKSCGELQAFLREVFDKNHLATERIGKICSLSVKAQEEGLRSLAKTLGVPFETFGADLLMQAEGSFASSAFVQRQVGADNVCERSACLGSGGGRKLVGRQALDGMTMAVYQREMRLTF